MPRPGADPQTNERVDDVVDRLLIARWREMSVSDRVALVEEMCHDVEVMTIAGIRVTNPDATEREIHELARRRFGDTLADEAFAAAQSAS